MRLLSGSTLLRLQETVINELLPRSAAFTRPQDRVLYLDRAVSSAVERTRLTTNEM